jgi:hypothetical protein
LVEAGNEVLDGGFLLSNAGWGCRVARPIDGDLLLATFTLPTNIEFSPEFDTVLDRLSWCSIEGPGAHPTQRPV